MSIKPLILGVSITLGLLAITVVLRFIIYPLSLTWQERRARKLILANDYQEQTIEIKINGRKLIN